MTVANIMPEIQSVNDGEPPGIANETQSIAVKLHSVEPHTIYVH